MNSQAYTAAVNFLCDGFCCLVFEALQVGTDAHVSTAVLYHAHYCVYVTSTGCDYICVLCFRSPVSLPIQVTVWTRQKLEKNRLCWRTMTSWCAYCWFLAMLAICNASSITWIHNRTGGNGVLGDNLPITKAIASNRCILWSQCIYVDTSGRKHRQTNVKNNSGFSRTRDIFNEL